MMTPFVWCGLCRTLQVRANSLDPIVDADSPATLAVDVLHNSAYPNQHSPFTAANVPHSQ